MSAASTASAAPAPSIVDGYAVRSCLMLTAQAEGSKVVTVEGLSNDEALTPLQASFRRTTRCNAASARPA